TVRFEAEFVRDDAESVYVARGSRFEASIYGPETIPGALYVVPHGRITAPGTAKRRAQGTRQNASDLDRTDSSRLLCAVAYSIAWNEYIRFACSNARTSRRLAPRQTIVQAGLSNA